MQTVKYFIANIAIGLIFVGVYIFGIRMVRRAGKARKAVDAPIISSHKLLGGNRLTSMNKGVIAGFKYNFLTNGQGDVMAFVDLGTNTNLHLIAIGDKSNLLDVFKSSISQGFLESVNLEGDFPKYFKVFATPGRQVEVRQIMEPLNMAQFVDYCRANDIEIFHDTMFISAAENAEDPNDPTTMMQDLKQFLEQNASMLKRL